MQERHKTFPGALEAGFLVLALYAIEYVIGAAFYDAKTVYGGNSRDMAGVIVLLGNGILLTALLHYKRLDYPSLLHPARHSVVATLGTLSFPILLLVPGLALVMLMAVAALTWLLPLSGWEEAMFRQMMSNGVISLITVCVLAPVLEEMFFRGIILRSFLMQYSRPVAIFGSAVLFGAAHLNIYQFVTGFVLGSIAGWIYERSQSVWPCIIFHGAYNSFVMWVSLSMTETNIGVIPISYWMASLVSMTIGIVLLKRFLAPGVRSV